MRRAGGFTLMDILLALLLVGMLLLALATVIPLSVQSMNRGQSGVTAANLARHYTDWWMQQDFGTVLALRNQNPAMVTYTDPLPAAAPTPTPPSPQQFGSLDPMVSGPTFHTQVLFNPVQDPLTGKVDSNVVELDVYVDWQAGGLGGVGAANSEVHYSTCVYNVTSPW